MNIRHVHPDEFSDNFRAATLTDDVLSNFAHRHDIALIATSPQAHIANFAPPHRCVLRNSADMDTDWIKSGLKKPGKTQRGLAAALGLDPAAVSRLLKGERQLKAAELTKIATYLDVVPPQHTQVLHGVLEALLLVSISSGGQLFDGIRKLSPKQIMDALSSAINDGIINNDDINKIRDLRNSIVHGGAIHSDSSIVDKFLLAVNQKIKDYNNDEFTRTENQPEYGKSEIRSDTIVTIPSLSLMPRDVPVLGVAVGGDDADFEFNGQIVDYVRRPPGLASVQGAFGVYVMGTSMEPRYEEGELVFVHPGRPARPGDDVIVEMFDGEEGRSGHCYIKRLLKKAGGNYICRQYNPPRDDLTYPVEQVKKVHRIMTAAELMSA
ncbi:S24 family peptidase [Azospirillum argentinense]